MWYRRMTKENVYEILRRWHAGQSMSRIASVERCDRKTIREYIKKFNAAGLRIGQSLPAKGKIWEIIEDSILPSIERAQPASKQLEPLIKSIREMIQDSKEPIKPKSAFKVLKAKHRRDSIQFFQPHQLNLRQSYFHVYYIHLPISS